MYRQAVAFEVLVRSADVAMPRLVAGNDNALRVRQVPDAAILQRIKLLRHIPPQSLAHLHEVIAEDATMRLLLARAKILPEQVAAARAVEHAKFQHQPDYRIVETYHAVALVLADRTRHEHPLLFQADVLQLYLRKFDRTDKSIVLHKAGKQEMLIMRREIISELRYLAVRKRIALFRLLMQFRDFAARILAQVAFVYHEGAERRKPDKVVVPRPCGTFAVNKHVVEKIGYKHTVYLIAELQRYSVFIHPVCECA